LKDPAANVLVVVAQQHSGRFLFTRLPKFFTFFSSILRDGSSVYTCPVVNRETETQRSTKKISLEDSF